MARRRDLIRRLRHRGLGRTPPAPLDVSADTNRDPKARGLLLALALAAALFFWLAVRPLFAPLVLAALTAVIFQPVHEAIERRFGVASNRSALVSILLLLVFVGGPLTGFAMLFVAQARSVLGDFLGLREGQTIVSRISQLVGQYLAWLEELGDRYLGSTIDLGAIGVERAQHLSNAAYEALPDLLAQAGSLIFAYLIFTVALFFLLRDWRPLLELVVELAPMEPSYALQILVRLRETVRAVFLGSLLTAAFQGSVGALGFLLAGFPNFAVWGALTAFAGFVPVVGTALVWGPGVFFLFANGDVGSGVLLLAFGIFISTTDNLLRLLFLGSRLAVHPLILFVAVFGGLVAVGPMGLIYGPLLAACVFEALSIYREHRVDQRLDDPVPDPPIEAEAPAADPFVP